MFAVTNKIQIAVCLLLSAVIIGASLSLGAFETHRAASHGYSVTITALN